MVRFWKLNGKVLEVVTFLQKSRQYYFEGWQICKYFKGEKLVYWGGTLYLSPCPHFCSFLLTFFSLFLTLVPFCSLLFTFDKIALLGYLLEVLEGTFLWETLTTCKATSMWLPQGSWKVCSSSEFSYLSQGEC